MMFVVSCSMASSSEVAPLEEMNRALDSLGMLSRPALTDFWTGTAYVRPHYRDKAAKAVLKERQKRNKGERMAEVQCRQEEALAKSKKNGALRKRNVYNADGTKRGKHSSSAPRKATYDDRCDAKDSGQEGPCEAKHSFWDELEEEEAESMYMWNGGMHEGQNDEIFGVEDVAGDGDFEIPVAAPPAGDDDEELRLVLQLSSMEFQQQVEEERREAALLQEHLLCMQPDEDDADLLLAIELSRQDLEAAQEGGIHGSGSHQANSPPGLHYRGTAREGGQSCMLDSVGIGDEVEVEPEPARNSVVKIRTRGTVQEIIGWDPSTGDLNVLLEGGVVGALRRIITV